MALINLDLALPLGSVIPDEIEVLYGSVAFDGTALVTEPDVDTAFELLHCAPNNTIRLNLNEQAPAEGTAFANIRFRYQDENNHFAINYDMLSNDMRIRRVAGGSNVQSWDVNTAALVTDPSSIELTIVTDGDSIEILVDGNPAKAITSTEYQDEGGIVLRFGRGYYSLAGASYRARPIAVLGRDNEIKLGEQFIADASGSNDAGATLTYSSLLTVPSGSSTTLVDGNTVNPKFTPDIVGDYLLTLTVNNGIDNSFPVVQTLDGVVKLVAPTLDLPQFIQGRGRYTTKLGKLFSPPVGLAAAGENEEYWFKPELTAGFPNWPSSKYPVIAYSSTDHADVNSGGGIYLRVYEERGNYDLYDVDSWHEWQEISNLPEFVHITQKTNPIFIDETYGGQTETPTLILKDGVFNLFYHNIDVPIGNTQEVSQTTLRATGTNPVDFTPTGERPLDYDPNILEGNSHDGYLNLGINTIAEIPYTYIGRALYGGGGIPSGATQQFVATNDLSAFEVLAICSPQHGPLREYEEFGVDRTLEIFNLFEAKKEGAYYRVLGTKRRQAHGSLSGRGVPVELLIDSNLNIVSRPVTIIERGTGFDAEEVNHYDEVEYAGKTWGFYKTTESNGKSAIGCVEVVEVDREWELFTTNSSITTVASTETNSAPAAGITYSYTPSWNDTDGFQVTDIVIPADGSASTAIMDQVVSISDHGIIDFKFDLIGKNTSLLHTLEFGVVDDLDNPTFKIAYKWNAADGTTDDDAEPMLIAVVGATDETDRTTDNYFGQSEDWISKSDDETGNESIYAKHKVGFRIIPSQDRLIVLEGIGMTDMFDIEGLSYDTDLQMYIKVQYVGTESVDSTLSFGGMEILSYGSDVIAVPDAPTLTSSKTTDTITLTASNVSGATSYKYFLDDQENDTGIFTGLSDNTPYTVYSRATNALGDSAPSEVTVVTTDEIVNTAPTATITGNTTGTVGTEQVFSASTSTDPENDTLSYSWVLTAPNGSSATLTNETGVSTSYTPDIAGNYTLSLTADDNELDDTATITTVVSEIQNTAPTPNAGPDQQNIISGGTLTLNGSNTLDPDGVIDEIEWNQTAGTNAIINDPGELISSVTLPTVTSNETMTFELTITDSSGNTYTDSVSFGVLAFAASTLRIDSYTIKFKDNKQKVIKGFDNEVFIDFTFANDFTLSEFTVIEVKIGDETYSTIDDPTQVYILENRLVLNIGENTTLEVNKYKPLIIGKNAYYNSGHVFTSPVNPVLSGDLDVIELS